MLVSLATAPMPGSTVDDSTPTTAWARFHSDEPTAPFAPSCIAVHRKEQHESCSAAHLNDATADTTTAPLKGAESRDDRGHHRMSNEHDHELSNNKLGIHYVHQHREYWAKS